MQITPSSQTPAQKLALLESVLRERTAATADGRARDLERILEPQPARTLSDTLSSRIDALVAAAEEQGWSMAWKPGR